MKFLSILGNVLSLRPLIIAGIGVLEKWSLNSYASFPALEESTATVDTLSYLALVEGGSVLAHLYSCPMTAFFVEIAHFCKREVKSVLISENFIDLTDL